MSYKNRYQGAVLRAAKVINGFTLPGAIHTSGIYPSARLATSFVGQCWTPDQGGVYRVAASGKAQVRAAKWQSSDSSWIAPDTYPTRSVRTRLGTARVPTGTTVGMVSSPAFTNKVTCRKTNPTDLTNITKSGDAAAVLSVVDDTAALAAAGLSQICSTGKVYKLDNSAGTAFAYASFSGDTGNTNNHSGRVYARTTKSGSQSGALGNLQLVKSPFTGVSFGIEESLSYSRYVFLNSPVEVTTNRIMISAAPGSIVYFILPELVESSYLPADPIVPLTPAADTLAAFTRAAIYMEEDTAGVFPTVSVVETLEIGHVDNPYATQATRMSDGSVVPVVAGASWAQNFAVFGTCVPDFNLVNDSTSRSVLSSFVSLGEYLYINLWNNLFSISKRIASTSYTPSVALNYAANAPFDYLAIQTIHGMASRIRPHATMTWSAWVTNVTTNGKKPAPIGSKYQIGAMGGIGGIAGKHPKVSIFELGNQASLAAYQDRAMLLAGRIA